LKNKDFNDDLDKWITKIAPENDDAQDLKKFLRISILNRCNILLINNCSHEHHCGNPFLSKLATHFKLNQSDLNQIDLGITIKGLQSKEKFLHNDGVLIKDDGGEHLYLSSLFVYTLRPVHKNKSVGDQQVITDGKEHEQGIKEFYTNTNWWQVLFDTYVCKNISY